MYDFETEYKSILNDYSKSSSNAWIQQLYKISCSNQIILYGCGKLCEKILHVCSQNDITVNAISDTYKKGTFQGYNIASSVDLYRKFSNSTVVITSHIYENQIKEYLMHLGFIHSKILTVPATMIYYFSHEDFRNFHLDGFRWAYEFFNDVVSKK